MTPKVSGPTLNNSAQPERLIFTTTAVRERTAIPPKVSKIRIDMAAINTNHERHLES